MTCPGKTRLTLTVMALGTGLTAGTMSVGWRPAQALDHPTGTAVPQIENPANSSKPNLSLEDRADIFMARKSYADALDYYYRALKQAAVPGRDSATLWNKIGIAHQQEMNYNQAQRAYKEAIRRRANFPEPLNNLGTTYYMENKFGKSVKYYLRAVQLSPNSPSFHMNLGTGYYRLKKYREAVTEYRAALVIDPNILTEHSSSGTVMQTRGADPDFYFYMAKTLALVGRTDDAIRYLRRAFEDGFKDHKRLSQDPDFQKISQVPAYVDLMKNPPVAIRE